MWIMLPRLFGARADKIMRESLTCQLRPPYKTRPSNNSISLQPYLTSQYTWDNLHQLIFWDQEVGLVASPLTPLGCAPLGLFGAGWGPCLATAWFLHPLADSHCRLIKLPWVSQYWSAVAMLFALLTLLLITLFKPMPQGLRHQEQQFDVVAW